MQDLAMERRARRFGIMWAALCHHKGLHKREGGRRVRVRGDGVMEAEVSVMQGQEPRMQAASRSCKRQRNGFPPEGPQPC